MDSADWARLPSEVLELVSPLLKEHLPVARLACKYWASELPRGTTLCLRVDGAGPPDWGTRLFTGLEHLYWSNPQLLHCAPWRSLRSLTIWNASDTDAALRLLFDSSPPFLTDLDVQSSNVTDAGLIGAPPSLTCVNLTGCDGITDAALASLGHVKSLCLCFCGNLNGSGLGQLKRVTYLDVSGLKISNWQGLATLTSLKKLNAAGVKTGLSSLGESLASVLSFSELYIGGTRDLTPVLIHLHSLQTLTLFKTRVSDESMHGLHSLKSLTVKDSGFASYGFLASLTSLQDLAFWQCYIYTDDLLHIIAPVPNLVSLTLCSCSDISDFGVARIRQLRPELRIIV